MNFNPSLSNSEGYNIYNRLNDVLIFYKDFCFESKKKKIELIEEELIHNKKKDYSNYLKDFGIAKEMNKRTPIIKYLYTSKSSKSINTEKEMTDMVKNWENIEKSIRNKKIIGEIQDIRNDSQYIIRNRNNDNG